MKLAWQAGSRKRIAQLEAENADLRREVERLERELEAKDEEWEAYTDAATSEAREYA